MKIYRIRCIFSDWKDRGLELWSLSKLAFPSMVTHLLRFINLMISIMVCGHLSREELDAASLANTFMNVFGLSVDTGFSSAFDTLFSQAYGSKKKQMLGIFLQRAICVVMLIFSLLVCLHLNIVPILLFLRQDALISSLTLQYIKCFLPGLACDFLFVTFARYLQAQNIVFPMVLASSIGTIFNIIAQYTFVIKLQLGIRTSALCLSAAFALMLTIELGYILRCKVYRGTWTGFDLKATLEDWGPIFRMGIPGLFMVSLEEWCFEIMTFVAGSIDAITLGAQAVTFQVQSTICMIPLGLFTAVNIRVGQKLGAFDPNGARFTYETAFNVVTVVALATGIPVILLRSYIPLIFTNDVEIGALASQMLPLLLLVQLCEGFGGVAEAVLLACGKQSLGASIIFVGYYCVGMPIAFILAYRSPLKIFGAWIGVITGFSITTVAYNFFVTRTDWVAESKQAASNILGEQDLANLTMKPGLTCSSFNSVNGLPDEYLESQPSFKKSRNSSLTLTQFLCLLILIATWTISLIAHFTQPTPTWLKECVFSGRTETQPSYCTRMQRESILIPLLISGVNKTENF